MTASAENPYESPALRDEYLVFHFARPEDQLPWSFGPREALDYPARCAELVRAHAPAHARCLDLGCAVGRSSFELSRSFDEVLGIDFAQALIDGAQAMQGGEHPSLPMREEGDATRQVDLALPEGSRPDHIRFEQGDACKLRSDIGTFDAVLMANLIDRLPAPRACLQRLPDILAPGGIAVITSPYTWLEEYTPRSEWLGSDAEDSFAALSREMAEHFTLIHRGDEPFLIREHRRKFQWSVADATVWRRT